MKNQKLKNRKSAESRLLTPWLFFVLGLIGVAIVAGVVVFFSSSIDVRTNEAITMSDKLVYGISDNGYLQDGVLNPGYDILGKSGISNESMNNVYFYFNVTIYDRNKVVQSFIYGNNDFEIQCRLNGDNLAKCFERDFVLLDKTNSSKIYKIKILSGSNNKGS